MLSHVSLGTTDLNRARDFYDLVFRPLGYVRKWTSERGVEYGPDGGSGQFAVFPVATVRPPGDGFHLAVAAKSCQAVDEFHATAMRLGASDEGSPGLRPHYGAGYYAAFIRDLDGYKLEAVFHQD